VPDGRQTWLFSATMLPGVRRIAGNYMSNPREVSTGKVNQSAENIEHLYYTVHARDRYPALRRIVDASPGIYGMIFCRTRMETQEVASHLIRDGYPADSLHGDLSQQQREAVMHRFRSKQSTILVATDVAARGIDISDITHVIHYQIPDDIENYTHRSGRTARAGKSGVSIAIVNTREINRVKDIERQIGKKLAYRAVPNGKEICLAQLMHLVDKIASTESMEEEISDYLPEVMERLGELTKEDLITRMLSAEFSRFLDHYKNAPDLNVNPDHVRRKPGEKSFKEHGRERERFSDFKGKKDDRRGTRGAGREDRGNDRRERTYATADDSRADGRLFLNLGSMDGFNPDSFRQWVADVSGVNEYDVKRIKLKDSFTFFEVEKNDLKRMFDSFSGKKFKGRKLRIDHASN
jgi:ATP-dependent RNA helicase DeaD